MTITTINYKLLPFCLCKSDPSIDTTTMSNVATKVAVVGGGISGAVCASTLAKNGISVTLFESARGPGGRMSQRREISEDGKELLFDHGASFFSASNSDVLRLVHEWESKGLVEEWKENFGSFDCISKKFLDIEQEAPNKKYVGIPGMNSICKALCNETGVESKFGVSIGRLECLDDEKWYLTGLDGQNLGRFSGVVVSDKSIASPRFTDVTGRPPPLDLSLTPELALKLQDIPVSPCFALMLAFSEPLSSISVKGFSFKNSEILSWSHCDSSKPGRSTASERWVLHSTANYARGVIAQTGLQKPSSATLTKVAEELFQEFQSIGLNIPRPFFMKAHRWGSAFPTASISREQKCLWDRKKRLAICGDFCVSPHVEGLRDEDSDLNRVAKEVARECKGLPIALVTVGRALRDKSAVEWEVAFDQLKKSQFLDMEQLDEQKNAYACLKLSYDYLKHEKTKLCFLLCCLFPEDYNIPIEDLTRYAVGYGLHQDVESIEDARKRVYVAIKNLKACCMLLGTETEEYVKMHDLVRDVAIQIASSEKYGFMVKAGFGLKEWSMSNKRFEGCTVVSLMGNKLAELPEGLVCPQLKVLLLGLDDGLNVPERFFEGMKAIEVLSLQGGCLSLQSLQFSTNLQSLLLIECECKDLIRLRKLQRLNILVFRRCGSIEELPDETGELKELRLLDLTGCKNLRRIPVNLIGRLKKLEELLIGDRSFEEWDVVGCDSAEGINASLTELSSLSHLAVLSLKIPKVECIPRDFVFPSLLKYDIVLGDGCLKRGYPTSTRLYLGDISATSLNAKTFEQLFPTVSQIGFRRVEGLENIVLSSDQMTTHGHGTQKDFLQRLEYVKVNGCGDIRTLFPAKWRQALKNLRSVEIYNCESLEEVFELDEGINEEKELRLLSSLTKLELSRLPELKCIWKGPTSHVSLQSLIKLKLYSLDKLTFIFTPSLAQSLIHLETLRIEYCRGLKRLIREKDDEGEIIPESLGFPKLKTLSISFCRKLEYGFPVSVSPSLQNLEEMEIFETGNLKQVFCSGEGDDIIVESKIKDGIIDFPQLRKLSLSKCSFFGPKDFAAQLPSLQELTIYYHEEGGNLLAQLRVFTSLKTLILSCLLVPDLRCIWKDLMPSHLTSLTVYYCNRLTCVFTHSMIASLLQLQVLDISNCEELEQIIAKDNDDEKDQIFSGSDLQSSCFPNLCRLEISRCNKLKSLFPLAMASGLKKLQELKVKESSQLLGVFGQGDHASHVNVEKEMVLPDLEWLSLKELPSIVYFSHGCCDFIFPRLWRLEVRQCPKLTTKFDTTSNGSMSAQSEVSQVAEGSSTGCSVPTSTCRIWTRKNGWEEEDEDEDDEEDDEDGGGHDD